MAVEACGGLARRSEIFRHVSRRELDRAVQAGEVARVARGWFASRDAHPAIPVLGTGCGLGCVSALAALGAWSTTDELHIHVPHSNSGRRLPTGVLHWSGVPLARWHSPVAEAVRQVAGCLPTVDAVASIDSVLHQRILTGDAWQRLCRQHPAVVGRLSRLVDARAESGLESIARLGLAAFSPQPQARIGRYRVDLLVGRVCVELDGYAHHGPDRFDADRRRDAELIARGFVVLHFSYQQVLGDFGAVRQAVEALVTR